MHEFLELLYCFAAAAPVPTCHAWFTDMNSMCVIVTGRGLEYDEDPFVVISAYHAIVETSTLNLGHIMQRFLEGDVSTSVWGPVAWRVLHQLAAGPRFADVERLLQCWKNVLPCPDCRHHLAEYMQVTQFDCTTPEGASRDTSRLHDAVNRRLGKYMFIE